MEGLIIAPEKRYRYVQFDKVEISIKEPDGNILYMVMLDVGELRQVLSKLDKGSLSGRIEENWRG